MTRNYTFKKGEKHPNWKGGISQKEVVRNYRIKTIEILGNKCIKCGFIDKRALQIDHINGGGTKERKAGKCSKVPYYKRVIDSFINNKNEFQLLCANCNSIKRIENKEVRKPNKLAQ